MVDIDHDAYEMYMEFHLTIAMALGKGCACAQYLVFRKNVLLGEILKTAAKKNVKPVDLFIQFARGLHERHSENQGNGESRISHESMGSKS